MNTREQNLRYAKAQLVKYDATASDLAIIDEAIEEVLGPVDVSIDNDTLRGNLPAGVGENKSIRWYARNKGGESFEDVAQDTYDNADTVEDSVRIVAAYIEQEATGTG